MIYILVSIGVFMMGFVIKHLFLVWIGCEKHYFIKLALRKMAKDSLKLHLKTLLAFIKSDKSIGMTIVVKPMFYKYINNNVKQVSAVDKVNNKKTFNPLSGCQIIVSDHIKDLWIAYNPTWKDTMKIKIPNIDVETNRVYYTNVMTNSIHDKEGTK